MSNFMVGLSVVLGISAFLSIVILLPVFFWEKRRKRKRDELEIQREKDRDKRLIIAQIEQWEAEVEAKKNAPPPRTFDIRRGPSRQSGPPRGPVGPPGEMGVSGATGAPSSPLRGPSRVIDHMSYLANWVQPELSTEQQLMFISSEQQRQLMLMPMQPQAYYNIRGVV